MLSTLNEDFGEKFAVSRIKVPEGKINPFSLQHLSAVALVNHSRFFDKIGKITLHERIIFKWR